MPTRGITESEGRNVFLSPDTFCKNEFQNYGSNLGTFFFFSKWILFPSLSVFLAEAAASYFYLKAVNLVILRRENQACVQKLSTRHRPISPCALAYFYVIWEKQV